MKKIDNKKSIKRPYNAVILFTVIYVLMVVMAIIERVSTLKDLSTTDITFMAVAKEFWFPFAVIALLVVTVIVYIKRDIYGVTLECAIGFSMIANVIVSVISVGFNIGALLGTLILPAILIVHSVFTLTKIKKLKSA